MSGQACVCARVGEWVFCSCVGWQFRKGDFWDSKFTAHATYLFDCKWQQFAGAFLSLLQYVAVFTNTSNSPLNLNVNVNTAVVLTDSDYNSRLFQQYYKKGLSLCLEALVLFWGFEHIHLVSFSDSGWNNELINQLIVYSILITTCWYSLSLFCNFKEKNILNSSFKYNSVEYFQVTYNSIHTMCKYCGNMDKN